MTATRVGFWLVGLGLLGCSGKPAESARAHAGPGHSADEPVVTCGPGDSYAYIAQRFRCPDGKNPLGGDLKRGAEARLGSRPAPKGNHILDEYEVPCEGGAVKVYVDMYGCPEYASMLEGIQRSAQEDIGLRQPFQDGKFEEVIAGCRALDEDAAPEERVWCTALLPASLYALKRDAEAFSELTAFCSRLRPATADNDARATQLALTFVSLATVVKQGKLQISDGDRDAMVEKWLSGCQVPEEQLKSTLDEMLRE